MARKPPPNRHPLQDGQESVWDYPRPPRLEAVQQTVRIIIGDSEIARTDSAYRVLETSHPPTYYLPPADIDASVLQQGAGRSFCEWKGAATYWSIRVGDRLIENCAWSYPTPTGTFAPIKDHLAFYAAAMDACYVGDELARPQPGGFYGGWVTSNVIGPFKGEPGTEFW